MVKGHLRLQNGIYHAVIDYKDEYGIYRQKSQSLKLPERGNKKKAEAMLRDLRRTFIPPHEIAEQAFEGMSFYDFLNYWLVQVKSTVAPTTYDSYWNIVKKHIIPFFEGKHLRIDEVQPVHLEAFYMEELKTHKANTVKHMHALLHKIFKKAYRLDLISCNPVEKADPPKVDPYIAKPFTKEEVKALIAGTQDHKLGLVILLAALYGLRRSEVLGLRWKAIDFENNLISINHTLNTVRVDGKFKTVGSDRTKTKSSYRQMPLIEAVKVRLLAKMEQEKQNRKLCGDCYNHDWDGYVFVNEVGNIITPCCIESTFPKILKQLNLPHHRFHDLRHTCATLMNLNRVPMKDVQEYLGHSNIQTTANIYTHLDWSSKENSIRAMENAIEIPEFTGCKDSWG